jgi:hydrogenase expression/formation protein HypD
MLFAIGFETTAPSTALTLLRARSEGIRNFSIFSNHVTIIPAIRAILDSPDMRIDGFIGPGHVSTVIGCRPYEWIARDEKKPIVVAGFEPLDLLQSIVMILRQLNAGTAVVENQYARVVPWEGNAAALRAMAEVFQLRPYFEWRGLGFISQSALEIREGYADWNAERQFDIAGVRVTDPKAAQCGEVLKGVLKPHQCKLFGRECTPERPVGALMVSSEGSCAAYFNYEHRKTASANRLATAV